METLAAPPLLKITQQKSDQNGEKKDNSANLWRELGLKTIEIYPVFIAISAASFVARAILEL
jgi:hypothetical protein